MKNLKEKMKKQGGFTLIEMLIVVAIIAILIAISIPLVSTALERARLSTDAANERSAKAEALLVYMTEGKVGGNAFAVNTKYYYNAEAGELSTTAPPLYGKNTTIPDTGNNGTSKEYIAVAVTAGGDVLFSWDDGDTWYENNGPVCTNMNGGTPSSVTPDPTIQDP